MVMRLKWKLILVCLEIVVILTRIGVRFVPNVPLAWKSFWTHLMELVSVVAHAVHSEIVLASKQDRCKVCAKRTIASRIVLDAPRC
jgi:hypothetical protein